MSSNFLEIKNATFVASKKNKIDNVSLTIKENMIKNKLDKNTNSNVFIFSDQKLIS